MHSMPACQGYPFRCNRSHCECKRWSSSEEVRPIGRLRRRRKTLTQQSPILSPFRQGLPERRDRHRARRAPGQTRPRPCVRTTTSAKRRMPRGVTNFSWVAQPTGRDRWSLYQPPGADVAVAGRVGRGRATPLQNGVCGRAPQQHSSGSATGSARWNGNRHSSRGSRGHAALGYRTPGQVEQPLNHSTQFVAA